MQKNAFSRSKLCGVMCFCYSDVKKTGKHRSLTGMNAAKTRKPWVYPQGFLKKS
jgi:hypothetical protein